MQGSDHYPRLRHLTIALVLCALAVPVHADVLKKYSWYDGASGRRRMRNLTMTAGFGAVYVTTTYLLEPRWQATSCRWCERPAYDQSVRDAVVWKNTGLANLLSNIDTFALAPAVGFGMLIAVDYDAGWARVLDDTIPVAASVAAAMSVTQWIKIGAGRRRPDGSDNLSFVSGHSSLGFAITASAGLICHWRGYWSEPYVWAAGITLSLSTEYLRMSADKHYLSDVLAGGAVGIASGLLIPRLMRQDIKIVPSKNGAAIAGTF